LTASTAINAPITPGKGPSTPASAQDGTKARAVADL